MGHQSSAAVGAGFEFLGAVMTDHTDLIGWLKLYANEGVVDDVYRSHKSKKCGEAWRAIESLQAENDRLKGEIQVITAPHGATGWVYLDLQSQLAEAQLARGLAEGGLAEVKAQLAEAGKLLNEVTRSITDSRWWARHFNGDELAARVIAFLAKTKEQT